MTSTESLPAASFEARRRFCAFAFLALCVTACSALARCSTANAATLSPLADRPVWSQLEGFQETITRDEFRRLLDEVYAPSDAAKSCIVIGEHEALIAEDSRWECVFTLRFNETGKENSIPRYWRPLRAAAVPDQDASTPSPPRAKPLAGVRIALDPGHLGGKWAKMEERWFTIGSGKPVAEGDMTLLVAKHLAVKLRALGADVSLVRDSSVPLTARRPDDRALRDAAGKELDALHFLGRADGAEIPSDEKSVQWHAEKLFYRVSEIRERGHYVNRKLKPDLTLCLHFNAERWGDPLSPRLTEKNHFHLLVNGCYSAEELGFDDIRFEMLLKLLGRCYDVELAASQQIAATFASDSGLPAYEYTTPNARRTGASPYVWTRNLLASRLYRCPVVYIEPYVMNCQSVYDRVQASDYEGLREVGGVRRKSIYREYADAVADGLAGLTWQSSVKSRPHSATW